MAAVTLKEKAYSQLKKMILEAAYKPGDFLTERTLVDMLGMSRTPIRSALERLDVEGLVNYTPNKGLVVAELSVSRAVDYYDFRIALETHVVRKLSARTFTPEEILWFNENLAEQKACADAGDPNRFTILDCEFHVQLAGVYDNKEIIQAMDRLQNKLFQILIKVMRKDLSRLLNSFEDHRNIYESILARKTEAAEASMLRHLEFGKQILIA